MILRASGNWDTEFDSPVTGYKVVIFLASNQFAFYKRTGGVTTQIGTTQSFTWTASTTFDLAFRVQGTTISFWAWTGSRPGTATYSQTDSSISTGGQFQLASLSQSAGTKTTIWDTVSLDNLAATTATSQVATSTGAALFDSSDGSTSLTLESIDAVTAVGVAPGAQKQHDAGAATGTAVANNATGSSSGTTSPTATAASSSGTANDATVTRTGNPTPDAAASTGTANTPTISAPSGATSATAQTATGSGDATGIAYLLDETVDPILDENGEPIADTGGLTVKVSPTPGVPTSAGVSNAPNRSVSTRINAAASTGSAMQPSISTTTGGAGTTNVNAAAATGAVVASDATTLVSPNVGSAASTGASNAPTSDVPVQAGAAESTGTVPTVQAIPISAAPVGVGQALDPQIDVLSQNFIGAAAIPIAASAPDAQIALFVYPLEIVIPAVAEAVVSVPDEPGQIVALRDSGHTVSLKER